jgi:hypothetical protein
MRVSHRPGAGAGSGVPPGAGDAPGTGRAIGAGWTERSGIVRTAPRRAPAGRWPAGCRRGERAGTGPTSARSSTSKSAATLRRASSATGSADTRAAVARWLLFMSPPEVVSATGEGVADKEKSRDSGLQ